MKPKNSMTLSEVEVWLEDHQSQTIPQYLFQQAQKWTQFICENERLFAVIASTIIMSMCHTALSPILPLYAKAFGVNTTLVSLTLSVFAVARLILNLPAGLIGDVLGRKPLLVVGPLITALGMLGSGISRNFTELLFWRFITGIGSALQMSGAQLYLADISTTGDRARKMGTNQAASLLGVSIGPAIGGVLADNYGLRAPFLVMAGMAIIAALYGLLRIPETKSLSIRPLDIYPQQVEQNSDYWQTAWQLLMSDNFRSIALVNAAIFMTANGGRSILMPLLGVADFGYTPGNLGQLFSSMAFVNMLFIIPASVVADQFGRKYSIIPSGLGLAFSLTIMAMGKTQLFYSLGALFYGFCNAFLGSAPAAYAADIIPTSKRGLGLGMYRCSGDVGLMLGPAILGAVADQYSTRIALIVNSACMILSIIYFGCRAVETSQAKNQQQN